MISIRWHDGKMMSGKSWAEVEEAVRASQWETFETRADFRDEMRHRAEVWTGAPFNAGGTPEEFLRALAAAGMCIIKSDGKPSNS